MRILANIVIAALWMMLFSWLGWLVVNSIGTFQLEDSVLNTFATFMAVSALIAVAGFVIRLGLGLLTCLTCGLGFVVYIAYNFVWFPVVIYAVNYYFPEAINVPGGFWAAVGMGLVIGIFKWHSLTEYSSSSSSSSDS